MAPITRGQHRSLQAHSALEKLPNELLLAIFSNLLEQDLCRVSRVCKRFHSVANDKKLWKTLYKDVFEYDLVLLKGKKNQFNFHSPADLTCANPWKMSMSQIYLGLHVRPGYQGRTFTGRSVKYFNMIQKAADHAAHNMFTHDAVLVFLHAGTHTSSRLRVNCNVALIGAAPGVVAESVVLHCINSGLFFSEFRPTYFGHISLQVNLVGSFYCGPGMVDHCIFHCFEDRLFEMMYMILNVQNGIRGLHTTHCVVMRPHGTKIQIPSSIMELWIGTEQPMPASCPWVQQGLDLTKHNGSARIAVCQSAGDDSGEDEAG